MRTALALLLALAACGGSDSSPPPPPPNGTTEGTLPASALDLVQITDGDATCLYGGLRSTVPADPPYTSVTCEWCCLQMQTVKYKYLRWTMCSRPDLAGKWWFCSGEGVFSGADACP